MGVFFLGGGFAGIFSGDPIYRLMRSEMWSGSLKMVLGITRDMFGIVPTALAHPIWFFRPKIRRDVAQK